MEITSYKTSRAFWYKVFCWQNFYTLHKVFKKSKSSVVPQLWQIARAELGLNGIITPLSEMKKQI